MNSQPASKNGPELAEPAGFPGLDYDFLRYMGVRPETMRQIQDFYFPYFANCGRVIDLGCGDGDFLAMLLEHGIEAIGVDSDEKTFEAGKQNALPIVRQDVFEFLHQQEEASADGIFCAHLVEHLPYPKVIELIQHSFRVLRPGGRIILATPNVRSLYSHLEMFYMHFGHISFYHPKLLCFFLEHEGFRQSEEGENTTTGSPLLPEVRAFLHQVATTQAALSSAPSSSGAEAGAPYNPPSFHYRHEIPPQGKGILRKASYHLKRVLTRWLVQPLTDDLALQVSVLALQTGAAQTQQSQQIAALARSLQSLNGAFECYATAVKP
ncbi:MAG TPA: methyltransferase domain-containing protein [Caldilinea sp.]|nr:class I SAM-dependent methyltransferase [Anaerolineales bacterium]HRA66634.1 methyltransferase domain-containing protein [Caldilinea sp.]